MQKMLNLILLLIILERLEDSLFKQNMIRIADLVFSLYAVIIAHLLKSKYKGF